MGRTPIEPESRFGDRVVADEVVFRTAKAAELLARYERSPPVLGPALRTFEDVECFWSEAVAPVLPQFK